MHVFLHDRAHWRAIARWLVLGMVALVLVVWFGRDVVNEIEVVEKWIAGHGAVGWVVFVGLIVVVTSFFFPLSVMAIAGGAMFGIVGGTLLTFLGVIVTAAVNYFSARGLLKSRIETMLEHHPKMRAIQAAVHRQGLRLQLLLRMAPINAVSVNYVLGATGVRFSTFMIATFGLIPAIIANVYFGYTASHVTKVAGKASEHSRMHTVVTVVGFVVCIAVMIVITRVATKAITEVENDPS